MTSQIPTAEPTAQEQLKARIDAAAPTLSRKQGALAHYLLTNTGLMAFATANEVGEATGVSAATVVRFAQTIGFQGFTDLRDSLRNGLRAFPPLSQQLEELVRHRPETPDEHVKFVFSRAAQVLAETLHNLDAESLLTVARELASADRIALIGTGISNSVLELLFFHLCRIGMPAIRPRDTIESVDLVARVTSRDVVVAAAYYRFLRSTSEWLRVAKQNGAKTVVITDSSLFPARDYADHIIVVASQGIGHGPSMATSIAIIDSIVSLLITTDPDRFLAAFERREAAYREGRLLLE